MAEINHHESSIVNQIPIPTIRYSQQNFSADVVFFGDVLAAALNSSSK
jgi:hypothetical protein